TSEDLLGRSGSRSCGEAAAWSHRRGGAWAVARGVDPHGPSSAQRGDALLRRDLVLGAGSGPPDGSRFPAPPRSRVSGARGEGAIALLDSATVRPSSYCRPTAARATCARVPGRPAVENRRWHRGLAARHADRSDCAAPFLAVN